MKSIDYRIVKNPAFWIVWLMAICFLSAWAFSASGIVAMSHADPAAVYVDGTNGSDANGGTSWSDAEATIDAGYNDASDGDTIWVKGGTYRETVTMDNATTAGSETVLRAWPGETVIISGAIALDSGWTQCADAAACYGNANFANIYWKDITTTAPIAVLTGTATYTDGSRTITKAGAFSAVTPGMLIQIVSGTNVTVGWYSIAEVTANTVKSWTDMGTGDSVDIVCNIYPSTYYAIQLFQNGVRLQPARYPAKTANDGVLAHLVTNGGPGWGFPTTATSSTVFADTGLEGVGAFADDYFNGSICHVKTKVWNQGAFLVSDYTSIGGIVTLATPCDYSSDVNFGYYFTNVAAQIDEAGDWAYRAGAGVGGTNRIFVYSAGAAPTGIEYSARDFGVKITGAYNQIKGIQVQYASISNVYLDTVANVTIDECTLSYGRMAGIYLYASDSCDVIRSTFSYNGQFGIGCYYGSDLLLANENTITHTGCGSYAAGAQVAGALNDDVPNEGGTPFRWANPNGIWTSSSLRSVQRNIIDGSGYNGIEWMGVGNGAYVKNNKIINTGLCQSDGGGIYHISTGRTAYDTISENVISGLYGSQIGELGATTTSTADFIGIYMDAATAYMKIENNVIYSDSAYKPYAGIFLHWANTITVTGNKIYSMLHGLAIGGQTAGGTATALTINNNLIFGTAAGQYCARCDTDYALDDFGTWDANIYYNPFSVDLKCFYNNVNGAATAVVLADWRTATGEDAASTVWATFTAAVGDEATGGTAGASAISVNPTLHTMTNKVYKPYYNLSGNAEVHGSIVLGPMSAGILAEQAYATVDDIADLLAMAAGTLSEDYVQTAAIDMTGQNFDAIGDSGTAFSGSYNGAGYTITALDIQAADHAANYQGLFGNINGGTVTHIILATPNIDGANFVGGIAGRLQAGVIDYCVVSGGTVDSTGYVGGLVGYSNTNSTIKNSSSSTTVTDSAGGSAGGLVGYIASSTSIYRSYSSGAITSANVDVGGAIGYMTTTGEIVDCYATGAVVGVGKYGGFVGEMDAGLINRCYATGAVTGAGSGFVGQKDGGTLFNCYNDSTIETDSYATGFATAAMKYPYTGGPNPPDYVDGPFLGWYLGTYSVDSGDDWTNDYTWIHTADSYPTLRWTRQGE